LVDLNAAEAVVEVGPFQYDVFVPEFVRRQLQSRLGETVTLRTIQYIDGNPQKGGRMVPRLVGFLHDAEREFFDLICQVDGVGVKKALQMMVRPVCEVAAAIEDQDIKALSTLPGIGAAGAERMVAKLRRKMARFALLLAGDVPEQDDRTSRDVLSESHAALVSLGHSESDAREKIQKAVEARGKFKSVEELLQEVYRQVRG
jgi:Holliday junction DNA helicase RuvA